MTFQIVLICGGVVLLIGTLLASFRGWLSWREGVLATAVITAGTLAALWPDATTDIARRVGIQRGADLILYCTTIGMMIGFVMIYIRLRRLRRHLTLLVRELAILEARENTESSGANPSATIRAE
jgi:hypothetical protein